MSSGICVPGETIFGRFDSSNFLAIPCHNVTFRDTTIKRVKKMKYITDVLVLPAIQPVQNLLKKVE